MAPPIFTATFNPSPSPPTSNQFLLTAGGVSVSNLVEIGDTTTISITLEGASFSSVPMVWSLPPDGGQPLAVLSGNTLSFTVPPPTHVLSPWVFRFVVDTPGATGVRSQNIYLAKPVSADPEVFFLKYASDNGNFSLLDSADAAVQDGVILGEQLVMVNTLLPRDFSVLLLVDPPSPSSIAFPTDGFIVWSSGSQPDWLPFSRVAPNELNFTIRPSGLGQSIGFQFAIQVTRATGETVQVLSPDPILVNATIGDG